MKRFFLGPFAQQSRVALLLRILLVLLLTITTQIGGVLVWPTLSMSSDDIGWKYKLQRWLYPIGVYLFGNMILFPNLAPLWSMEALPCSSSSYLQPRTTLTCLSNRQYLKSESLRSLQRVSTNIYTSK